MNRILIIAAVLLSALEVMADKKITIRNADTGESFEMTVSDGFKMYSYNVNWLDSIPYLIEHARYGEPWAYEAIAECHRYGKGGIKRSLINSLCYYDLSGKDIEDCIKEIGQSIHDDPVAVFGRLIDYLENNDYDRVLCAIDTLHEADYHSADILGKYLRETNEMDLEDIMKYATNPNTDPDASVFACVGYALTHKTDSTKIDISWAKPLILEKIPYMYSLAGKEKYEKTIKSENSDGYAHDVTEQDIEDRRKAAEYLLKADEYGALTKKGARLLHHYLTCDPSSEWISFSDEDIYRIKLLAGIDE